MSTQHPDNVHVPFFAEDSVLGGEDEIQEAFYAYSHLNCHEQMWDFEGKEVDNFVVKKLLSKNEIFFKKNKLGQDLRLTFRVPNPEVEKAEAKILLETLESIPRSFDAAKLFYKQDIAPVFEVILPMSKNAEELNRIYYYYKDMVAGKQQRNLNGNDMTIAEWIGEFKPETINVIPLFEDKEDLLRAHEVVKKFLKGKHMSYQRVFLARSDPAVNYGSLSAVLLNKIALQRLQKTSKELGIPLYPILGAGSAPFRGNLRPQTVERMILGYPSVHTYTIQSSFKFDHQPEDVRKAIEHINNHESGEAIEIDEPRALEIIERYSAEYRKQVKKLASVINKISPFVPKRRKRKLHIGLFGYSRDMDGIRLPRAITFTAALYSIGIPPELLGLNAITPEDKSFINSVYTNFEYDLRDPLRYTNIRSPFMPPEVEQSIRPLMEHTESDAYHAQLIHLMCKGLQENVHDELKTQILEAARIRGYLG